MESNKFTFKKIEAGDSLVYSYQGVKSPSIRGQIDCTKTDLYSDLSCMIDQMRQYLDMAFMMASECPESFDASTAMMIADHLLDAQKRRIESIFDLFDQKSGQLMIVTPMVNKCINTNQVVDAYIDESRKFQNGVRK